MCACVCLCVHAQVTPETLQRKRRKAAIKKARYEKSKAEAAEYHKLLMQVGGTRTQWGFRILYLLLRVNRVIDSSMSLLEAAWSVVPGKEGVHAALTADVTSPGRPRQALDSNGGLQLQ